MRSIVFRTLYRPTMACAYLLGALLLVVACKKPCQTPPTQGFTSLTDTPWRLVQSTDPQMNGQLDNYNFLIVTFNRDNTGDVKRVVDNDQYDTPVLSFVWAPSPQQHLVRIQYSSVTGTGQNAQSTGTGDQGTFDYSYSLGTQLNMRDYTRGYTYRYVPFEGVVNPDTVCSFW